MPNRVNLPSGSELYGDSAYIDHIIEDNLEQTSYISLKVMPKKNSKHQNQPWNQCIKQHTLHDIETVFSPLRRLP